MNNGDGTNVYNTDNALEFMGLSQAFPFEASLIEHIILVKQLRKDSH